MSSTTPYIDSLITTSIHWPQVTDPKNFDFVMRWVSTAELVGDPPTKKSVQARPKHFAYIYRPHAHHRRCCFVPTVMTERLPSKSYLLPTDSMSLRTKMTRRMELIFCNFCTQSFNNLDLD